jgi:hypothetical protein
MDYNKNIMKLLLSLLVWTFSCSCLPAITRGFVVTTTTTTTNTRTSRPVHFHKATNGDGQDEANDIAKETPSLMRRYAVS